MALCQHTNKNLGVNIKHKEGGSLRKCQTTALNIGDDIGTANKVDKGHDDVLKLLLPVSHVMHGLLCSA